MAERKPLLSNKGVKKASSSAPRVRSPRNNIQELKPEEISAQQIRSACHRYVSQHGCYGSNFVRDMTLLNTVHDYSYYYRLETLGEERSTYNKSEGCHGECSDPPAQSHSDIWSISVMPTRGYENCRETLEVPNSSYVTICESCNAEGTHTHSHCGGQGWVNCVCPLGRNSDGTTCSWCHGSGRIPCTHCHGTGRVQCSTCRGCGKVRHFQCLTVWWTHQIGDSVTDMSDIPRDLIKEAEGKIVFEEEKNRVTAVSNKFPRNLVEASRELIDSHYSSRITKQFHQIKAVPVTKVTYSWKNKNGEFYIYGSNKHVYFKNYPQWCCCCCLF